MGRGNYVAWISAQHEKYGRVVRVAPGDLSYIDAQAWKDVYGHRIGEKGNIPKHRVFYGEPINGSRSLLHPSPDVEHARVRKIFTHAFSDKALKEQEPLFQTYVNMLIRKLQQELDMNPQHALDMVKPYNFTTFDIMGDLTFGEPLHLLQKNEYSPWVAVIFNSLKEAMWGRALRYFPLYAALEPYILPKSMKEQRLRHFRYSSERVDRRLAAPTDQPDIWTLVMRYKEDGGLTRDQMHSNAVLFMVAGTETTATLLSGLTFHLLKNPDKMAKLTTEIRTAFAREEEITIEALARLKYLNACLEEGLRIYPPVPAGFPRQVPDEGATICGEFVPPGTTVYVNHLAAFTSELNFAEPKAFIPERWLGDERFTGDVKAALQPFSFGPRNCLGKNLAYHEMRLILSKVLWHFDLELCPESENWADQKIYILWDKRPLMCRLSPVERPDGSRLHSSE